MHREFAMARLLPILVLVLATVAPAGDEVRRVKYGADAVPLSRERGYLRTAEAADFWALVPYYAAQPTDSACSTATAAMVVNALRVDRDLRADDALTTPATVLARSPADWWAERVATDGDGVTLDEFAPLLRDTLRAHDVADCRVEILRFEGDEAAALARLRAILTANERSGRDLLVANFLQSVCTGDPEGAVGHVAPIAAHDPRTHRVLILDPDRRWYEPYWVPDTTLLRALRTTDETTHRPRGLLHVTRPEPR